jgi:hypothetical protein
MINLNRMARILSAMALLFFFCPAWSQKGGSKVYTTDIDHFWEAFDSIQTTRDSVKQLDLLQRLYIDRGTAGLKAFIKVREYTPQLWVALIRKYPRFWRSVRPNTLTVKNYVPRMEESLKRLKTLYPQLQEATIYFTIGGLNTGGTISDRFVLIGTEITAADAATEVSEFESKWLEGVFKSQKISNIVPVNIHEYVHTQQKEEGADLLGACLYEGAADFITELVMGSPLENHYIRYGKENEARLKASFQLEMFTANGDNWLYNGQTADVMPDLGYFMGYAICKAYYDKATDKKKAIKEIIELPYGDTAAVEAFLVRSGYYPGPLVRKDLLLEYEAARPSVVRLEPFSNGDTTVNASVKELRIVFSRPMNKKRLSFSAGEKGKDYDPVSGIGGYAEDGMSLVIKLDLQPGHDYEFLVTDQSFRSVDGLPLKPLKVAFRTK